MAHNLDAYVIATGGPAKREWLTSLGADQFLDYTSEDVTQVLRNNPVDLVLDFVGGKVGVDSVKVTQEGGLLLQFNQEGMVDGAAQSAADSAGVHIEGPAVHIDKQQLADIAKQAEAGKLSVTITDAYDLDNIREAHGALDRGHFSGKLVVRTW